MRVLEYKGRLIEVVIAYPTDDEPVTLECTDLRSEMLFAIHSDQSGELVLKAWSENIPLELITIVGEIAKEDLS